MEEFLRFLAARGLVHDTSTAPLLLQPGFLEYLLRHTNGMKQSGIPYRSDIHVSGINTTSPRAKFAYCTFNTTIPLKFQQNTLQEHKAVLDAWQALLDPHNAAEGNGAVQALLYSRYWFFVMGGFAIVDSTIKGVIACIVLAYLVLLWSTLNYVIATIATTIIAS